MVDENGEYYRLATPVEEGQHWYGCLACGRLLKAQDVEGHWVAIHDDVDHTHMTFEEEDNPQ